MNPRSVYNKSDEFKTFIEQKEVDVVFMSESWERQNLSLKESLQLDSHEIISNVYQRKGAGGRPAIFVDQSKFEIEDLTNKYIQIPWGVEAVWCLLTPKNVSTDSLVQKIACCALYVSPSSQKKKLLLDHISDAYNLLSKKYPNGLHFCLSGDTNHLKLDSILSLDSRFAQIVNKPTRMNPPAVLDTIITSLGPYYQEPECLDPLDNDPDKKGASSDHRIVICKPISVVNNKPIRQIREIKFRPLPQSGFDKFEEWLIDERWESIYDAETAHLMAENFQNMLMDKVNEIFPIKVQKFKTGDKPWFSFKLRKIDRKRKRIYSKERKSAKWKVLDQKFRKEMKKAKSSFYEKNLSNLKHTDPRKWYSSLKRLGSDNWQSSEVLSIEEIKHLSDKEQAEKIASHFSKIPNEYDSLKSEDIVVPTFNPSEVPQFSLSKVWFALKHIKTNKADVQGDIPARLIKKFASYLAEPLTHIYNTSMLRGEYPSIYKYEVSTPIPKVQPTEKVSQLRNISGLPNFDKIFEKLLAELVISDMEKSLDPSQFGNRKGLSIQHYLISMIHRILTVVETNSSKEAFAVIASLVDWNNAFPRQCPKLGVESFQKNGVRPSLIPLLTNYFQGRKMVVKWHGVISEPKDINGGGPQGATLGLLEYLSQSNDCANFVSEEDRFKFVDDLTILEIVDLLSVGITNYNIKEHVPSDVSEENSFIPMENLKTSAWMKNLEKWSSEKKMLINGNKSKCMIFNFTNKYQFNTRVNLSGEQLEFVDHTKLLGSIISQDLSWELNIKNIVKKANARMQLLRRVASFGAPIEDLKQIYILFVRSQLEHSATVWHSGLTVDNIDDLERVQKTALRIILGSKYRTYNQALTLLDLSTLHERRENLCLKFTRNCLKHPRLKDWFPIHEKKHHMQTRNTETFHIQHTRTKRLQDSPIIYMQRLLNKHK